MRKLIRKEKEIYDLFQTGLIVGQIAKELLVSIGTVQFWLDSAKEKKRYFLPEDK